MKPVLKTFIAAVLVTGLIGCAKEKSAAPSTPTDPNASCASRGACPTGTPPPPGSTPDSNSYSSGGTAELKLSGGTPTLARMFFESNPNNPQNIRINVDIRRQSDSVIISHTDNGQLVQAKMGVVHPYSGHTNKQHNGWVNQSGKSVWKGFFQDSHGAIVLIVDQTVSQGDGDTGLVGGEVWFQNFNKYYPNYGYQGSLKMCWEISMGPYDCRTFLVSDRVNVISSYYPNNKGPDANMSYERLGTFTGISADAAGL